ncbi:efflux RND transporter periplasmic adaptor subunit [Chitinophaga agrisoli]|uniref:Efflux RND transporter periplasmic adaptor subunit n=1 Tax=Chitinophaga agrisoli TaxID=2607653 RepID=A0A5B2VK45_9BACT|nr:efflux RND transporter periplasmic adaptor subunit [Chitinophaga agrisoli]KAA2238607.1 efflux RND transporter periplasmic adaptor subunit [Chitinophaga agrisoli]
MKQYIIILIIAGGLYACSSGQSAEKKPTAATAASPHYEMAPVSKAGVAAAMKLPAQLSAYQEITVFPKVNGYVKEVLVDIGTKVKRGQLLMSLEDPELDAAAVQAREKYARAQADYAISKENYSRLLEASQTKGAISPMDLAASKAKMQADSALCNAEKASWEMQKALMGYLQVTAPFDGVITERNVHPGALVGPTAKDAKPMLELKQEDRLRLQVDVPENIAGSLDNRTKMDFYLSAFPGKRMSAQIARRSENVNTAYRMERVEMDIWNKDGQLHPGMYADVVLDAGSSHNAFSVPVSAVVTSTERKYVILVRNGKTVKQDVITGNATDDKIEVFGDFRDTDRVIVNANDEIKEGEELH